MQPGTLASHAVIWMRWTRWTRWTRWARRLTLGRTLRATVQLAFAAVLLFAGRSRAVEIAPGVELIPGRFVAGPQPDGNSIVLRGADGLLVFDTGRHPEHTQAVLDYAKAQHQPIVAVVNSHWHLDHVGGNVMIRKAFPKARVYASDAIAEARTGFLAGYRKQLEQAIAGSKDTAQQDAWRAEIGLIDAGAALAPDEIVTTAGPRRLAGRDVELGLERRAVTAGDVWLFDPATRVLLAGDLVTVPVPFLDTACPKRWQAVLDRLGKKDWSILVPGHGAPMPRRDFETYRAAFDRLIVCGASQAPKAECIDGWMKDADGLLLGNDPKFVRSVLDYYVDTALRGDAKHTAALCGE